MVSVSISLISIFLFQYSISLFFIIILTSILISIFGILLYRSLETEIEVEKINECYLIINSDTDINSEKDINYSHNYLINNQKIVFHISNSDAFLLKGYLDDRKIKYALEKNFLDVSHKDFLKNIAELFLF